MSIVGNPILLSGGRNSGLFNFPITFSTTTPTAKRKGHIWIKSSNGGYVNSVAFVNNISLATIANNSLVYEVFNTNNLHITINQNMLVTSENKTVNVAFDAETVGNHPWLAGEVDGLGSIYLPYPRVFIKKDNVLYIETAYVWTGTDWHMLCESDTYLICGLNSNDSNSAFYPWSIYNRTNGSSLTEHELIDSTSITNAKCCHCASYSTGEYLAYKIDYNSTNTESVIKVFRRIGDTFTLSQTITNDSLKSMFPSGSTIISGNFAILNNTSSFNRLGGNNGLAMTWDGKYLLIPCAYCTNTNDSAYALVKFTIVVLENINGQYQYKSYFDVYSVNTYNNSYSIRNSGCMMSISADGNVVATEFSVSYSEATNSYTTGAASLVSIGSFDNGYTVRSLSNSYFYGGCVAPDGSCGVYTRTNSGNVEYRLYSINIQQKTITDVASLVTTSLSLLGVCITPDNHIWCALKDSSNYVLLYQSKYINGAYTAISGNSPFTMKIGADTVYYGNFYGMAIDTRNNLVYMANYSKVTACTMTRDTNGKVTALTQVSTVPYQYKSGNPMSLFITPYF